MMPAAIPLTVAVLVSVGIIVIGCFYVLSPQRVTGGFGLRPPAPDADTRAWLRLKGIRDIASGVAGNADWQQIHRTWDKRHRVRIAVLALAAVLLIDVLVP